MEETLFALVLLVFPTALALSQVSIKPIWEPRYTGDSAAVFVTVSADAPLHDEYFAVYSRSPSDYLHCWAQVGAVSSWSQPQQMWLKNISNACFYIEDLVDRNGLPFEKWGCPVGFPDGWNEFEKGEFFVFCDVGAEKHRIWAHQEGSSGVWIMKAHRSACSDLSYENCGGVGCEKCDGLLKCVPWGSLYNISFCPQCPPTTSYDRDVGKCVLCAGKMAYSPGGDVPCRISRSCKENCLECDKATGDCAQCDDDYFIGAMGECVSNSELIKGPKSHKLTISGRWQDGLNLSLQAVITFHYVSENDYQTAWQTTIDLAGADHFSLTIPEGVFGDLPQKMDLVAAVTYPNTSSFNVPKFCPSKKLSMKDLDRLSNEELAPLLRDPCSPIFQAPFCPHHLPELAWNEPDLCTCLRWIAGKCTTDYMVQSKREFVLRETTTKLNLGVLKFH